MPNKRTTDRFPAVPASHLPTVAGGAMLLWLLVEFAFRRGLAPVLADRLGTGLGADMVSSTLGISLAAAGIAWWGTQAGITPADWDYTISRRTIGAGIAGVIGIYVLRGMAVAILTVGLGFNLADGRSLGVGTAPVWALGAFLLVNGMLGPIAEELAWRGVIQTALSEAYGTYVAVGVTAVAFVLKHLIVDLSISPFRTTALVVLAFGLCGLRARYGTTSSTIAHVLMNSIETLTVIIALSQ